MKAQVYNASLDTLAKGITAGVFMLFIAIGQSNFRQLLHHEQLTKGEIIIHSGVLLLFVIILLVSYLPAPQKYVLTQNKLIIKRPLGDKAILLTNISEVKKLHKEDLKATVRTFGVGGLFGYYGRFYNAKLGHMTWYLTQRKNMVLLKTQDQKKIIISPDDISLANQLQA